MAKKKVISKGYTIEVTSWENDGDNYRTEKIIEQDEAKAKAIGKMCKELFKSSNNGENGIGNLMNDGSNRKKGDKKVLEYMKKNPILSNNKKLSDEKLIETCMNYNYNLMGGSEYYYSRVCEKVSITYAPEDVILEEIKF
jgi:hypothetical protein